MKKLLVLIAAVVILQSWSDIKLWLQPPLDPTSVNDADVVLFATSWCGYCAKTRRWLDKNQVTYEEYDIEKSAQGRRQYEALRGRGVPLLVINGEVISGYDPAAMKQALTQG